MDLLKKLHGDSRGRRAPGTTPSSLPGAGRGRKITAKKAPEDPCESRAESVRRATGKAAKIEQNRVLEIHKNTHTPVFQVL